MTKFEQVGINYQYSADNKEDALRKFQYSCNCCCTRGMHINCDHCAIAVAHNLVIAAFNSKKGVKA